MKRNSQAGQVGFLVALFASAVLVGAGLLAYNVTQSTRRSAEENQSSVAFNVAETYSEYSLGGQVDSFNANPLGFDENELNKNFQMQRDMGVVYTLKQGETLELNPSKITACQENSCIVKIWWDNRGEASAQACDGQAALLASEYSLDKYDANQFGNKTCQQLRDDCNEDESCLSFYESCAQDAASVDPRTGLSRERARYYLFRPAICGGNGVETARDWAGYETAIGNPRFYSSREEVTKKTGNMLSIDDMTDSALAGTVKPVSGKTWQNFPTNSALSDQFANYYEIPVWPNTTMVRIKPLFAETQILVGMAGQITEGTSTATDGNNVVRTVEMSRTLPSVPSIMDYALFVGGGAIEKPSNTGRDVIGGN